MSAENESLSIISYLWSALIVPLGWLFHRQNKVEDKLNYHENYHMSKEEIREYVALKQESLEIKLTYLIESINELKRSIDELNKRAEDK
jgi:hypothetical protein